MQQSVYNPRLETRRGRGRPRRRWIEGVTDTLRLHNITAYQTTEKALSGKPKSLAGLAPQNVEMDRKDTTLSVIEE
jgi:hypothetical protein